MKQLVLSGELRQRKSHGGELAVGKRKSARPIVTKRAMHLVMRAECARGPLSFLRKQNAKFIRETIRALSERHAVKVYEFANSGNHLHLLLRARTRGGFKSFLRALSGTIAMRIGGGRKGRASTSRFWTLSAFTRIVEWGRAFTIARGYVVQNTLEALGLIPFLAREVPKRRRSKATDETQAAPPPLSCTSQNLPRQRIASGTS